MRTSFRLRAIWLTAILLLVVALALTSCGAFGRRGADNNGAYSSGGRATTAQTQATPDLRDIESMDQSLQSISQSLPGISTDANTDYSSQDTPQQP